MDETVIRYANRPLDQAVGLPGLPFSPETAHLSPSADSAPKRGFEMLENGHLPLFQRHIE